MLFRCSVTSGEKFMVGISKAQFETAKKADEGNGPLATGVRYRRTNRKLEVEYENGVTLSVPVGIIQELHSVDGISQADLSDVRIWAGGRSIFFPRIDVSIWTPALLKGVFGTKAWMRELARGMASITSPAKAAAARENGKKGGRPRKSPEASGTTKTARGSSRTHPALR